MGIKIGTGGCKVNFLKQVSVECTKYFGESGHLEAVFMYWGHSNVWRGQRIEKRAVYL